MAIIPNGTQNLVFDKASAPDLQQAQQPARKQAMFKNMVDARGCEDGDAGAVKNQILSPVRYKPALLIAALLFFAACTGTGYNRAYIITDTSQEEVVHEVPKR